MAYRDTLPAAFLPLILLALSGCVAVADSPSPTDPPPSTTTTSVPSTTTTTISVSDGLSNFRACLMEQGVSIDEVPLDGLGRPQMTKALDQLDLGQRSVLNALDACGPELVSGALDLSSDPELRTLVLARLHEFASCVRANGSVRFPDPDPDFNGVGSPFDVNRVPWTDPALADAVTVCSPPLGSNAT